MQKVMVNSILKGIMDSVAAEAEIIDGQAYVSFDKIGEAICKYFEDDEIQKELWKKQRYYFNYIRKAMVNKEFTYIEEIKIKDFVNYYVCDDETFEEVKQELSISKNWSTFWKRMENKFDME